MRHRDKIQEMEKRKFVLHEVREEILGKFISEKEHRFQWLVKLMDIEDELEELSRQQRKWNTQGKLTSVGHFRRRKAKY